MAVNAFYSAEESAAVLRNRFLYMFDTHTAQYGNSEQTTTAPAAGVKFMIKEGNKQQQERSTKAAILTQDAVFAIEGHLSDISASACTLSFMQPMTKQVMCDPYR